MSEKPKEPLDTDPHPDYASLTYGDVKKAKQSALLKAEKARRDAAIKKIEAAEVERLMQEEGISTEEMVEIVLEGSPDQPWFSTNGKRFPINQRIVVPVSVARDLNHRAFCGRQNEARRLGQDMHQFYRKPQNLTINHVGGKVTGVAA